MAKTKVSFEDMKKIHQNWMDYDKTGTQEEVFKKHGWSRTAFFNEIYYETYPDQRPPEKQSKVKI